MHSLLKKIDPVSKLYPHRLSLGKTKRNTKNKPCLIRPGGLGDLVVLTRACNKLGLPLRSVDWIVEKRNSPWLQYLSVPHLCYDKLEDIKKIVSNYGSYNTVIVSEQYHGLAAATASYLASKDGEIIGFDSNPRCDIFTKKIIHNPRKNHEFSHFCELLNLIETSSEQDCFSQIAPPIQRESKHSIVALSGEYDHYKSLSHNEWKVILSYAAKHSAAIYLVGTKQFLSLSKDLCRGESQVINLVGSESFAEVVNKIREAKLFVGVDSGLMHVADYFNIPSHVLFRADKTQWQPQTKGSIVFESIKDLENFG